MPRPGEYVADGTEGITRVEDLPKAKLVERSRNRRRRPCPQSDRSCYRHRTMQRTLHDLGDLVSQRPRDIRLIYWQHYCCKCKSYFNADMLDLAPPKSHYTHGVIALAVRLAVEDGPPYRAASWHLWRDHRVFVPYATIQNWVEAGGKKAEQRVAAEYLAAVDLDGDGDQDPAVSNRGSNSDAYSVESR